MEKCRISPWNAVSFLKISKQYTILTTYLAKICFTKGLQIIKDYELICWAWFPNSLVIWGHLLDSYQLGLIWPNLDVQELNYTQHKQQRVNKNGGGGGGFMNGVYYILCMFFYYSIFRFKWLGVYTKFQKKFMDC